MQAHYSSYALSSPPYLPLFYQSSKDIYSVPFSTYNGDPGPVSLKTRTRIMERRSRAAPPKPIKVDGYADSSTMYQRTTTFRSGPSPVYAAFPVATTPAGAFSAPMRTAPLPRNTSHDALSPPTKSLKMFYTPAVHTKALSVGSEAKPQKRSKSQEPKLRLGPFKFSRALPQGTFGKTYIARDSGSGRVLCTRVFDKAKMREDTSFYAALLTELLCYKSISTQKAADKTYLMELYAVLQDEDNVIYAMPLMQCDLLSTIHGRTERSRARRWIAQVALGLDALHRMGIIHRDIKPENILLDPRTDTARITDFNAAFLHPGDAPLETDAVYTREFIGSRPYLAPEVIRRQWYGKMVDWWALGCTMFDLVTGELLFSSDAQRTKYMNWDVKKEGTSFLRWAADLSREEEGVLVGLLHTKPKARFQLKHLQTHRYFVDESGANVFDTLKEHTSRVTAVTVNPDDTKAAEASPSLKELPLCYATASPWHSQDGALEFREFAWMNPRGLWASS